MSCEAYETLNNRNALMYIPWCNTTLASNIYMTVALYMACNPFICTFLFGLLESSKMALFKDLLEKIIEAKVAEIALKKAISAT